MKVLVTGGAGYIGSITVEQLIQAGDEVVVLDNLYQGHRAAVHPAAAFVQGDLADRGAIDALMAAHRPEAIIHFASYTLVGESMQKPFLYLGDNIRNGLNLLESAAAHGVGKFILSSTANLFDDPERMPIDENERIVPGSPYGESKNILERILYWLDRTMGLRYACLRYFNASGASAERGEDHTPEAHLIPLVLQVALGQRDKITIFGDDYNTPDGTCVRDYIHVEDLAQAHLLALDYMNGQAGFHVFNLGTGQGNSVAEVLAQCQALCAGAPASETQPRRPGDPATLVASATLARETLGWTPRHGLDSILRSALRWHQGSATAAACPPTADR